MGTSAEQFFLLESSTRAIGDYTADLFTPEHCPS